MAEPVMRPEIKDPLALNTDQGQQVQFQQGGAPRLPSSDYTPAGMGAKIQASLGVFQNLIHDEIVQKHEDAITEGKMAYMSGKTEADLAKEGNYYTSAGYHLLKTRDDANVWFQKEADYITNEGSQLDSEGYMKELGAKRKSFIDGIQDPYAKQVAAAAMEDFSPRLIEAHVKANSGYEEARRTDQFKRTLGSSANTSADTPRVVPGGTLAVSPTIVSRPYVSGSADDRDIGIRTILGEAAGEGEVGMAGVAWVLRNRADKGEFGGKSIKDVALSSNSKGYHQFSAWNADNSGGNNPSKWSVNSDAYNKAGAIYDAVMSGKTVDPTGGALYYYAPGGMTTGKAPTWWTEKVAAAGGSVRIGNQLFAGKGPSTVNFGPEGAAEQGGHGRASAEAAGGQFTTRVDAKGHPMEGLDSAAQGMLAGVVKEGIVPELVLNSTYRNPEENRRAGGAQGSQHLHKKAFDVSFIDPKTGKQYPDETKKAIVSAFIRNGARGVGIYKSGNALHVDTRAIPAAWGWNPDHYSGKGPDGKPNWKTKAPVWAREPLAQLYGENPPDQIAGKPSTDAAPMTATPPGPSTTIQTQMDGYNGISPIKKADALTEQITQELQLGNDSTWNAVGGAGGAAKWLNTDQLFKIQQAREKFEKAEDAKFDLDRERRKASYLDRIADGEDKEKVIRDIDADVKAGLILDRQAPSLVQAVYATERRKDAGASKLPNDARYVRALGIATRAFHMAQADRQDKVEFTGDDFTAQVTAALEREHIVLNDADRAEIEKVRQGLETGATKEAISDFQTEKKAAATKQEADKKYTAEHQLDTPKAKGIIFNWVQQYKDANISQTDQLTMDVNELKQGITTQLTKDGLVLGEKETGDLADKILAAAEEQRNNIRQEVTAAAKKVQDNAKTKSDLDWAIQNGRPIDGISGQVTLDAKTSISAHEYAISTIREQAMSNAKSDPALANQPDMVKAVAEKVAYEKMAKMGLVDTAFQNTLNGRAYSIIDAKTKQATPEAIDDFNTYRAMKQNSAIPESYMAKFDAGLTTEAQALYAQAMIGLDASRYNTGEALAAAYDRMHEKLDLNQTITKKGEYESQISGVLNQVVDEQFNGGWVQTLPSIDLESAKSNPENRQVLLNATRAFADQAWIDNPNISAKAAADIAKGKVLNRVDFVGDQFIVSNSKDGKNIRDSLGLSGYEPDVLNTAMNQWFMDHGKNLPEWATYYPDAVRASGLTGILQRADTKFTGYNPSWAPVRPRYRLSGYNPDTHMISVDIFTKDGNLSGHSVRLNLEAVARQFKERDAEPSYLRLGMNKALDFMAKPSSVDTVEQQPIDQPPPLY